LKSEKLKTAGAKKTKRPSEKTGNLKKTWKKSKTLGFGPNPFPPHLLYIFTTISFYSSTCDSHKAFKEEKEILLSH